MKYKNEINNNTTTIDALAAVFVVVTKAPHYLRKLSSIVFIVIRDILQ